MNAYDRLVLSRRPSIYWPASGLNRTLDSTTSGLNATTASFIDLLNGPGPEMQAVRSDGGQGFERVNFSAQIDNLTMEIWVHPQVITANNQGLIQNAPDGGANGFDLLIHTNGQIQMIAQGIAFMGGSSGTLPLFRWSHVVVTRKATEWTYWINGKRDPSSPGTQTPSAPDGTARWGPADKAANFRRGWTGCAFYSRPLEPNEILENYQAGVQQQLVMMPFAAEASSTDITVPLMTLGANGYEPTVVGPEELDAPFATIDVDTFTPSTPGSITPPFFTLGFYAGPVQPGSESPGPPVPVEPVVIFEGALPPVVPPSLPPTIGGGSGAGGGGGTVPPVGPGIPLPPLSSGGLAGIRFYQGPPWRWVVTDLDTNTITFLDRLTLDATVTYGLNKGSTAKLSVPSANPEVNILHTDGEPFVSEGNRLLYGFRREGDSPLWKVRFAGKILQVEDHGELENARTIITAFDPWHLLYQRPMIDEIGEFPDKAGFFSFDDTQIGNIALIFLRNTILNNGSGLNDHGDLGIDTGDGPFPGAEPGNLPGTTYWEGEYEDSTQIDTKCEQGMMVGEVWDQQFATGAIDIVMTPVYDPVRRPGYMADLSIFEQAGGFRPDAVFAWDKPSRNLRGIDALKDGTNRANTIRYYYGQGGPPSGGGIPLSYGPSILKYGETWAQTFYAMRIDAVVNAVATLQLDLMQDGVKTVTVQPAPERMPFLFTEFWLGDRVPVFASDNLRSAIEGYQRIYGVVLSIDENSYEQVPQLLVSPSDV